MTHRSEHRSGIVSASEVASWVYCPEQWRLQSLGHESENVTSLKRGERFHESTAAVERSSRRVLRLAGILIVVAENLPAVWWRFPVLVLSAAQNGILEEIVVVGYLLSRLDKLGVRPAAAIAISAVIRGSYHLYQGIGAFFGNAAMGVIFGIFYYRYRRVTPLIIAHTLIDAVTFVGYALLAGHVSWLPAP